MNQTHSYDIAVVGMAGRFPRAQNPDELWERIRDGENCISFFTEEQLRSQGVKDSHLRNPSYVAAAPVLQDIESFDASFFGLTPREAEITDPQQRLFFECCWEALENAGYDPHNYGEPIGVFAGSRTNTYLPAILSHPGMAESIGMFHRPRQ
ncbi:MAG TPA: beta-ketoacyl synthase N-terminal-like domain-containing protein [Candidatus Angelobacter sp.]